MFSKILENRFVAINPDITHNMHISEKTEFGRAHFLNHEMYLLVDGIAFCKKFHEAYKDLDKIEI